MLITEGLAELKTLAKRIAKKRENIRGFLTRIEGLKDPLEKDGGSVKVIAAELQGITDLSSRVVAIRTAIQQTNLNTTITIEGVTKSIAEWLTWRKELSEGEQQFLAHIRQAIHQARAQALSRGNAVVAPGAAPSTPSDLLINVDEGNLNRQAESLETVLGNLDGQLSLKNATVQIEGLKD